MIKSVKINNFVIVNDLELDLGDGLIALTGETGAGKSVIAGAIDSVFGCKIKPGSLYNDSKPAAIDIVINLDKNNSLLLELMRKYDFDTNEEEIFFRKEINTDLRGKVFINGRRISNRIVTEFREILLDFHSQRDQQKLFDNNYQLEVIDAYADLSDIRNDYSALYTESIKKLNEFYSLQEQEKSNEDMIKLFEFQLNEIKNLKLIPGEDDKLHNELNLLQNSQEIIENSNLLEQIVYENENSVYDILNGFLAKFRNFEADNEHIKNAVNYLKSSLVSIDDAVSEIRDLLNYISVDEVRQRELENRLNIINSVKQKYKLNIKGLLDYIVQIRDDIDNFSSNKEKLKLMQKEMIANSSKLYQKAEILSQKRKKASLKLEKEIKENIKKLAIPQADVKIIFNKSPSNKTDHFSGLNLNGQDEIEIFFTANEGIKMQALRYAASGGELSRFLLTIKKILTNKLENKTIIFDEIDAGIGGNTAKLLGDFINDIGNYHQILCITHLAQIAIYAKKHYSIIKKSDAGNAEVIVTLLNKDERREEIARMLAGSNSELALKYAEEILAEKEKLQ